jgi:uncharacterized protein YfaS (alpha-2-macroglobulin family)
LIAFTQAEPKSHAGPRDGTGGNIIAFAPLNYEKAKSIFEKHILIEQLEICRMVPLAALDDTSTSHNIVLKKKGHGPLYWNAYLTNFTLEDPITKAGLEIKINRAYYKLVEVDKTIKDSGSRGQAVDRRIEKTRRVPLANLAEVKSGDIVLVELTVESKNDYEYIVFEDMKPAGFEPVEIQSGYRDNGLGAYMELRDERVAFFLRTLGRGRHSLSYQLRAEIPGSFSALPSRASAMYAPELKANSDELKLRIAE